MGVLRRFVGALLLTVVGLLIAGFATGRVASVVTNGISMVPTHHAGDLVLVVRHDHYSVGDIVAYRDEASGQVVLHRIVGETADGFTIKGDNNQSTDDATPTDDELIGAEVFHVPGVGRWFGSPIVLALLAGLLIAIGALTVVAPTRPRPGPGRPEATSATARPAGSTPSTTSTTSTTSTRSRRRVRWWHLVLVAADAMAVAALVAAYAVPPTEVPPPPVPMHVGSLAYSAEVAAGDTYPDGVVQTGQPVFSKLADQVAVEFRYDGDATVPANARLRALLGTPTGWSTSLTLAPLTPVVAGGVELHGTLDLAAMRDLLARVQDATGLTLTTVELRLEAVVTPDPDSGASTYTDQIVFRLDELGLHPAESTEVTPSLDGPVVASTQPVRDTVPEAREVGGVPREARRWLIAAVLVLIAATVTGWPSSASDPASTADETAHDSTGRATHLDGAEERVVTAPAPRPTGSPPDSTAAPPAPPGAPTAPTAAPPASRIARVTRITAVDLPPVPMRVRLSSRHDLDELAIEAGVPVLERDDGWAAVVTPTCLHWWEPDAIPVAPPRWAPSLPIERAPLPPPPLANTARSGRGAPRSAIRLPDDDPFDVPLELSPHELPTAEIRLDAVEQLRDEYLAPRRPLFGDRRRPENAAIRSTIDDIVAYLADAPATRSPTPPAAPQAPRQP